MDTQEYDWVRLYTEKSPAKPFYSFAGDSAKLSGNRISRFGCQESLC